MPRRPGTRCVSSLAFLLLGACASPPAPPPRIVVTGEVRDTEDTACPSAAWSASPKVPARVIAPPVGCAPHPRTTTFGGAGSVSRVRQASLYAIDDALELERRFACALFDVTFPRERVASFTTQHTSSTDVQFFGAVLDDGVVRLLFTESTICQGVAATNAQTEILVAFDRAAERLAADVCHLPQPPCGPVP